eukprot:gnl/TRDRNA2_/TRDRNA2_201356_c0_seq1.p1 gnl/TRDRNA2_/TRDRNA2_201356_c0~~gnl/TRDRNA2_/TRDRNA2_201356_c0_seq1.p1  ORF type:complete len:300 (+),score=28.58 gnl/TRDRNA2_/TRDRNA2_201356_c0_seq1:58-900(+)
MPDAKLGVNEPLLQAASRFAYCGRNLATCFSLCMCICCSIFLIVFRGLSGKDKQHSAIALLPGGSVIPEWGRMDAGPIRGGNRGGTAAFDWEQVKHMPVEDRDYYIGHSVMATHGRWQYNKDVHWYTRDKEELRKSTEKEQRDAKKEDRMFLSKALGVRIPGMTDHLDDEEENLLAIDRMKWAHISLNAKPTDVARMFRNGDLREAQEQFKPLAIEFGPTTVKALKAPPRSDRRRRRRKEQKKLKKMIGWKDDDKRARSRLALTSRAHADAYLTLPSAPG